MQLAFLDEVLYTKNLDSHFEMSKFGVKVMSNDTRISTKRRCMFKNTSPTPLEFGAIECEDQWEHRNVMETFLVNARVS
jgi:hypothetical protein